MATAHHDGDKQRQSGTGQGADTSGDWGAMQDQVGQAAGAAVEQGRHFLDAAKAQALGYADQRKNDVAQTIVDLASSLRESGRAFEDRPQLRTVVDSAVQGLEQVADTIRTRSIADIVNDVEAVVRRRPAMVAAATLAAGVLVARFIRSSAEAMRGVEQQRGRSDGARRWDQQPMQNRSQSYASSREQTRA
jgi:hypothetical protein